MIDQQPHKHLRMKGSEKIVNLFSMSQVGEADDFLVIRGKGRLELVSGRKDTEKGYENRRNWSKYDQKLTHAMRARHEFTTISNGAAHAQTGPPQRCVHQWQ